MKLGIAPLTALLLLTLPSPSVAAEGPKDVETDHLDAFDDGGPRAFGVLVDPAAVLLGVFGVEADAALGDAAALSLEGDMLWLGRTTAASASVGLPLYPQGVRFHGLYVHPRLSAMHATSDGAVADLAGIGATLGWQWTLRCGLTLRLGGGAVYERALSDPSGFGASLAGLRPLLDGTVGWVF